MMVPIVHPAYANARGSESIPIPSKIAIELKSCNVGRVSRAQASKKEITNRLSIGAPPSVCVLDGLLRFLRYIRRFVVESGWRRSQVRRIIQSIALHIDLFDFGL